MRRSLFATACATAVAAPLGALVQRGLSFELVSIAAAPPWRLALTHVLAIGVLGALTALVAGAPVDWAARRWRLPGAPWSAVPLSAALAVGLFALSVPWRLEGGDAALLLVLTAAFFAVRVALLGPRPAGCWR